MSEETMTWLNNMTRIGFTAPEHGRGNAWHYRANLQEGQGNHYAHEIPVQDARELLDRVRLTEGTATTTYLTEDGVVTLTDPNRKSIVRPVGAFGPQDPGAILGSFKGGYKIHAYGEWLINNVSKLLDDDLRIGSVGLLKGGAVAWVQVEMPDTMTTPEGVAFRPHLTAATSADGSLATGYQAGAQLVVCDNTLSASRQEEGARIVKAKHSSGSLGRIERVRDALGLVYSIADDFAAEVAELCATPVSARQFDTFVGQWAPVGGTTARAKTLATNKAEALRGLYAHDERVAPWAGTAFGVVQAVNTWAHHAQTVKNMTRGERNMTRVVLGQVDKLDSTTRTLLTKVLAAV